MDEVKIHPLIIAILSSGLVVAIVREASQLIRRRMPRPTLIEDYERLVDQLQQEVGRLVKRVAEVEARNAGMVAMAEQREAELIARLNAVKEANRIRIEALYANLEQTRIKLDKLSHENEALRARLPAEGGQT